MADVETRADVERLVRAFYEQAMTDEVIGWLFTDVAGLDLEAHLPRIADFWETVLLGGTAYRGGAFAPHAALHARAGLRPGHFARWLALFTGTVDDLFAGPRADVAKQHARRTAAAFERRVAGYAEPATAEGFTVIPPRARSGP